MIPLPLSIQEVVQEHYEDVIESLKKRIKYVMRNGAVVGDRRIPQKEEKDFLNKLLKGDILKSIIISEPEQLVKVIAKLKELDGNSVKPSSILNRLLYGIFINTEYNKKFDKWKFINRLNLDTCAYCNRSYTYSLCKKDRIKTRFHVAFENQIIIT